MNFRAAPSLPSTAPRSQFFVQYATWKCSFSPTLTYPVSSLCFPSPLYAGFSISIYLYIMCTRMWLCVRVQSVQCVDFCMYVGVSSSLLDTFAVQYRASGFLPFFIGDPQGFKGRERRQNGATDPNELLAMRGGVHLEVDRGRDKFMYSFP